MDDDDRGGPWRGSDITACASTRSEEHCDGMRCLLRSHSAVAFRRGRRALTLIDVMITTMVLGIIVAATVPVAMTNERTIVLGAVRQVTADLEYAQVRSITQPTTPTVVAVLLDRSGYYLANSDTPEAPMELPEGVVGAGDPYAVTFGGYRAQTLEGVSIRLRWGGQTQAGMGVKTIEFDQYGRLTSAEDAVFEIAFAGSTAQIRVSALTGTVRLD